MSAPNIGAGYRSEQPAADPNAASAPDSPVAADVRRSAIDRMMQMNALHASNAWELRRRDPIAAHGLALLFAQRDDRTGRAGRYQLTAATKLWLAGEAEMDLAERLFRYHHSISSLVSQPGSDVRRLTNRRDADMDEDAVYVGLGVSSLDTCTGAWSEVVESASITKLAMRAQVQSAVKPSPKRGDGGLRARVSSDHDVPGTIRILLTDGTAIVAERRGMHEFNHRVIHSTGTLNYTPYETPYPWSQSTRELLDADASHGEVLRWMGALNDLFWQTDEGRLVGRQAHRARGMQS
jgi:hypothetical protein